MAFASLVALVLALLVAVPIALLAAECLAAALLPARERRSAAGPRPRTVVLVPACDEELALPTALDSVLPQLASDDRVLVVAHNCTDGTAALARAAGADVVEVSDDGSGGKPAALEAGLAALDGDPPDVVAIVDADCHAEPGTIEALARAAHASGGPVQGVYLFDAPAGNVASVSRMALVVKNLVRPAGLHKLGLACLLNGSGSAYPFRLLRDAPHGEGSIAEDYQLSIDLARKGHPTRFCPEARVDSALPAARRGAWRQRKRWEHGHLELVSRTAPRLLVEGLAGRPALLVLGLDLLVPPLSFLALAWGLSAGLAAATLAAGEPAAARVAGASGALFLVAVVAGWLRFVGPRATAATLVRVPFYVLWKVPLYLAYASNRERRWTKTPRDLPAESGSGGTVSHDERS